MATVFFHGVHASLCSDALPFFFLEQLPVLATQENKRIKLLSPILACMVIYLASLIAAGTSTSPLEFAKLLGGWMRVVADVALLVALLVVIPRNLTTSVAGTFRYDAIVSSSSSFDSPMPPSLIMARARGGLGSKF